MKNTLNFETALEILKSDIFDDDCSYMGAMLFVADAFNVSVDSLMEKLED